MRRGTIDIWAVAERRGNSEFPAADHGDAAHDDDDDDDDDDDVDGGKMSR